MAAVVLLALSVQAYNPFDYYPFTALQPPAQETPEVAAARASHMAAHAAARGVAYVPAAPGWNQPVMDTPEVWAAKMEHYRAHSEAAAANGVVSTLPALMPYWGLPAGQVQDTPEVAAAKAEFFRAYNEAAARAAQ